VSLGFRRRRAVNLESSCKLGRKSPERLRAGPATRGDRERLRCLSSPPSPERRFPWDIHPPTCSGKFPPGESSRATETRELPIRLPGPERSSRTGPRGAPTARRKSRVPSVCQARAQATSLNHSGKYPTSGTYSKSRRWLDLNPDFFLAPLKKQYDNQKENNLKRIQ
uniref:Uncharacterized protein n=1 Tax=Mandrillus leucophaeus TaxID=9568 RepID=A0A2K6A377_MANLE